jgi:3-phosphoshikimate 1-carboxyvinyltransferase
MKIHGTLQIPGDKSISHRALIFSLLAKGKCRVTRLSPAADCQSTADCLSSLGVTITKQAPGEYEIDSPGLHGLRESARVLDAGNSGTTIRLMSGVLAGQPFASTLDGDESLQKRPMSRVLNHLVEMGAKVLYAEKENYAPFQISGGKLHGKQFKLSIASAQVQTAIILAGLQAEGKTSVELPSIVRDHTERMLRHAKVPFVQDGLTTTVSRLDQCVDGFNVNVAGDISSAAFFMVAAACLPGSELRLPNVGLNKGRALVVDVLREMGADIAIEDEREEGGEPMATIIVRGAGRLKPVTVGGDRIAAGIDEIPILALAGAVCDGVFSVRDAAELRVKESDRLALICANLRAAGAKVDEQQDGFDIHGVSQLAGGCDWKTDGDHRLAMMGIVASAICKNPVRVDTPACVVVSYPNFEADLASVLSS